MESVERRPGPVAAVAPQFDGDDDPELHTVYNWVDEMPLTRPKRNIARDFADGVLCAEIVHHYLPKLVEMHNYSAANGHSQKMYNWKTLNQKVLKKLNYQIHAADLDAIIKAEPKAIERVLRMLKDRLERAQRRELQQGRGAEQIMGAPPRLRSAGPSAVRRGHDDGGGHSTPLQDGGDMHSMQHYQQEVDTELLLEKDQAIAELREMTVIMAEKIKKLEQLVKIKDSKIEAMQQKLTKYGLM